MLINYIGQFFVLFVSFVVKIIIGSDLFGLVIGRLEEGKRGNGESESGRAGEMGRG